MSGLPMLTRLNDLKRQSNNLKEEAGTAVKNIKSIVDRSKSIVVSLQSVRDAETFLRRYPAANSELNSLNGNLVKLNCELEILLSKLPDIAISNEDLFGCDYSSFDATVDTQCVATNTEGVNVNSLIEYNQENVWNAFDLEVGSILEMKYLLGDHPLDFWLGHYPSEDYVSHMHKLSEFLKAGKCQHLKNPPAIGQFIVGSVYRGCVLSIFGERIVVLDFDTGVVKFTNSSEVWKMEEDILLFPPQAINCRLSLIPNDIQWCEQLKSIFRKCMSNCSLVVTIKDILPNIPPTFVVEVDAHDGTALNTNLNLWIDNHVVPCLEKLKAFDMSGNALNSFYDDLDPYSIFQVEDCECGNTNSSLGSVQNVTSLCNDNALHLRNTSNSIEVDTSVLISDLTETDIPSCSNISSTNNMETIDITSPTSCEVTKCMAVNELHPRYCVDNENMLIMKPVDNKNIDLTYQSLEESPKLILIEDLISKYNEAEVQNNGNFENSDKIKSVVVRCDLERGKSSDMYYVQGSDPWNFALGYISDEVMGQLIKQITRRGECGLLKHFPTLPQVGDFAVGLVNGLYFRARVAGMAPAGQDDYLVVDIDSSELKIINVHELFILEEEFALVPARAIKCSLWNITRTPTYWNTELGDCFREVLRKNVLKVTVRDLFREKNCWRHIVQIKISSEIEYDLSEWIMLHVVPKLSKITNLDISHVDCLSTVEKLNPEYLFPKKQLQTNAHKQSMDLHPLKSRKRSNSRSASVNCEKEKLVSVSDHGLPHHLSTSRLSADKSLYSENLIEEPDRSLESFRTGKVNERLGVSNSMEVDSRNLCSLTDFKSICGLKIGKKYYAFLSHIRHPGEFYVHLINEHNTIIDELQMALCNFCSEEYITFKKKAEVKQLISMCCAVCFQGQWCRARIVDWLDNSTADVKVFLVDYGIHTSVAFYSIQYLKSEFYKLPVLALKCELAQICPLNNSTEWPNLAVQCFLNVLDFSTVYCVVVAKFCEEGIASVFLTLKDNENVESVNDYLVNEGVAKAVICHDGVSIENSHAIVYPPVSTLEDLSSEDEIFQEDDWFSKEIFYFRENTTSNYKKGDNLPIVVTEIINGASFYAVINSQGRRLGKMTDICEILVELSNKIKQAVQNRQLRIVKNYVIGAMVVACYSKDNVWYRARLVSPVDDDGCVEVFFVDYGNTDIVKKDQVREITKTFSLLPLQAIMFFINGINLATLPDDRAKEKAKSMLCPLLGKVGVTAEVVALVNGDIYVAVTYEGMKFGSLVAEALT